AAKESPGAALHRGEGGFRIRRFGAGALVRAVSRALHEPELLDVARNGGLRRLEAAVPQAATKLLLAVQRGAIDEFENGGLTARFHETGTPTNYTSIPIDPIRRRVYKYTFRCIHLYTPERRRRSRPVPRRRACPWPARRATRGR